MLEEKFTRLKEAILRHESLLVAFSGGVDSALLLKVADDLLGSRVAGCTALTPSLSQEERVSARQVALEIGAAFFTIEYDELSIPGYASNQLNRCFLCKSTLFSHLKKAAIEKGFRSIAYGANHDDLNEFRPGMKAAEDFKIAAPLLEAGLTKEEIRRLGRELGLSVWNKPALACLSSRIPFGTEITPFRLLQVEQGEAVLRKFGFNQCRVRHHDPIARIEVPAGEIGRFLESGVREAVVLALKQIGYKWITVDLEGYRPGGSIAGAPRKTEEGS
jgi:uncharacterized protein